MNLISQTNSLLRRVSVNALRLRKYAVSRKRFYRRSSILDAGSGYWEVTLDQKRVKTPAGQVLRVENESLALALSNEWDAQQDSINMSVMHLHGLCCTAMDNPSKLTKLDVAQGIVTFLETDTILYLSEEPTDLIKLQSEEWLPIIEWFNRTMNLDLQPTNSISPPVLTQETKDLIMRYLMSHSFLALHGFGFAVEALKSVILTVACMLRHISVEKAVSLSRLEEDFQSDRWGRVEWSHDVAEMDTRSRVAAATLIVHLSSSAEKIQTR